MSNLLKLLFQVVHILGDLIGQIRAQRQRERLRQHIKNEIGLESAKKVAKARKARLDHRTAAERVYENDGYRRD